jgi:hypothetical protein
MMLEEKDILKKIQQSVLHRDEVIKSLSHMEFNYQTHLLIHLASALKYQQLF